MDAISLSTLRAPHHTLQARSYGERGTTRTAPHPAPVRRAGGTTPTALLPTGVAQPLGARAPGEQVFEHRTRYLWNGGRRAGWAGGAARTVHPLARRERTRRLRAGHAFQLPPALWRAGMCLTRLLPTCGRRAAFGLCWILSRWRSVTFLRHFTFDGVAHLYARARLAALKGM